MEALDSPVAIGAAIYGAQIPRAMKDEDSKQGNRNHVSKSKENTAVSLITRSVKSEEMTWHKEFLPYLTDAQSYWRDGRHTNTIDSVENMVKELNKFIANLYYMRGKELLDFD